MINWRCRSVSSILRRLPGKGAEVLRRYCGLEGPPETMRKLALDYGLTIARVNQLKWQAVSQLRANQEFMALAHDYTK